jgi:hypothetical protein
MEGFMPNTKTAWAQLSLILIIFISLLSALTPYFNDQSLAEGYLFSYLTHVSITLVVSLFFITCSYTFSFIRNHWVERYYDHSALGRKLYFFESFFFLLFVPLILSVPLAHSFNQLLDFNQTQSIVFDVHKLEFQHKGVLETRRCHAKVLGREQELILIKYRPMLGRCQPNQTPLTKIEVQWHTGFLGKAWISRLRLLE